MKNQKIKTYSSKKELAFYEQTTKREMFLVIEQFAELLKDNKQHWTDRAKEEVELLKINGIK